MNKNKKNKKNDLLESIKNLKNKKKKGELETNVGIIDIIIPKPKRNVQLSNKVTEETYNSLKWMAKKNEQTISLILEKAIAEYRKNHFDNKQ